MDRLEALQMFVRVVESGSFSAAARERGLGQPAVSKQIAALESHLGAQLLLRTSRSLTVTDAGQEFYESALRLVGEIEAAESRVGRRQRSPSGLVRATVAPVFGRLYIVPRLFEFFARYPEISVELLISDRTVNLIEEGIDVDIRNGDAPDSSLVARKIAVTPIVTVATSRYLQRRGIPKTPSDIDHHSCVIYAPQGAIRAWGFEGKFESTVYQPKGRFRTNDAEQIRAAVLANLGLAHTPGWLFASEIASGAVQRILREYEPTELSISAVYPGGRRLATKVQVFIDFLAEILAKDPQLTLQSSRPKSRSQARGRGKIRPSTVP
jgi:LysR family transcriptional regulator, regulator for bpeEF and oprC